MKKPILVVLPHPDDEVFPMAGTISKFVEEGRQISYACLTLGEMGRNLGNPPFANRLSLPAVREKELRKSCEILGIEDLHLLGFHDKTIEFEPYDYIDGVLANVIANVKPEVILAHYPGYGVHPDHDACGAAVVRTVGKMDPQNRPKLMCIAFPDQDQIGPADVIVDVTAYMDKKMASMRAHSSQFTYFEKESENLRTKDAFFERMSKERFWYYTYEE